MDCIATKFCATWNSNIITLFKDFSANYIVDEDRFPQLLNSAIVSPADLNGIASELTAQDCIWLGRLVGLDDIFLDDTKKNCGDSFECCQRILREWTQRTRRTEATYGQLARALLHETLNKVKVVEKYCVVHQEEQIGKYNINFYTLLARI